VALIAGELRAAGVETEVVVVSTLGDELAEVPLEQIAGQGAFAKGVQAAVLDGRADGAVHSAKDLPPLPTPGLVLAAVPVRADPRDALVGATLGDLAPGALVATGSARRRVQLANLLPHLRFTELRGNMATRIERAGTDGVAAVVVAMAALVRLGWEERATEVLSPAAMLPQVGQGALAVECRPDDEAVLGALGAVDDPSSHRAVVAERSLLAHLGADCSLPVGGWARPDAQGAGLVLDAMVASLDGRIVLRHRAAGTQPAALGRQVATWLAENGGAPSLEGWSVPRAAS
jgi:hydroxymethylbilane synthase